MSHKVHPKSFRIKGTEDWIIRGFYGKNISKSFQEDYLIREFLKKQLAEASVAEIEIEHSLNKMNIIINTARPGIIIGRGGEGVEKIKNMVAKRMVYRSKNAAKKEIKIEIREMRNPWISAALIGQAMAQQIEKRMPFRQVLKRTIEKVMANKEIKGIRVEVSGRLNGIEIARKEWLRRGRLPRNTIRADIDYSETRAFCTYGTIGIKVWLYKGEKFK